MDFDLSNRVCHDTVLCWRAKQHQAQHYILMEKGEQDTFLLSAARCSRLHNRGVSSREFYDTKTQTLWLAK